MRLSDKLPPAFPGIRPFQDDDTSFVVDRINRGSREGVFRHIETVTAESYATFVRALYKNRWDYECRIIEFEGHQAGYFDLRARGRQAEILGVYLDPEIRSRGIGTHCLLWAVSMLRERGVQRVFTQVYSDNRASKKAFRKAGFCVMGSRRAEDGRVLITMDRTLTRPPRLGREEPRSRDLRGENLYLHHVAIAERVVPILAARPGVEAILGLGSLCRGFADRYSDIDLVVIGRGVAVCGLRAGEEFLLGTSIDLFLAWIPTSAPAANILRPPADLRP